MSEHPGVVRIDEKEYKRLTEKSRRKPKNYRVENPQNGINLQVDVTRLNGDEVLFRAELEPNDHGIESTGPKHYKIKPRELYPVFREPHPNVKMIEGVNFALFKGNTTVDLIND